MFSIWDKINLPFPLKTFATWQVSLHKMLQQGNIRRTNRPLSHGLVEWMCAWSLKKSQESFFMAHVIDIYGRLKTSNEAAESKSIEEAWAVWERTAKKTHFLVCLMNTETDVFEWGIKAEERRFNYKDQKKSICVYCRHFFLENTKYCPISRIRILNGNAPLYSSHHWSVGKLQTTK